MTAGGERHTVI